MINSIISGWRADFYNRSRQTSYLVILLAMVLLTLFFFPATDASYQTLAVNGYRGIYNSPWMGAALATLEVAFLPIICFYLVKNAVEHDRNNGLGELIAATPVTKFTYLAGKWLSNLSLLTGIALVMLVTAVLLQMWFGEDYHLQFLAFLLPQIIFVFPVLTIISGFALLFEMIPALRGGFGNIAYFFLWVALVATSIEGPASVGQILQQMEMSVLNFDPSSIDQSSNVGIRSAVGQAPLNTFVWTGLKYNAIFLMSTGLMLGLALFIFLSSQMFFDRFSKPKQSLILNIKKHSWKKPLMPIGRSISHLLNRVTAYSPLLSMIYLECLLIIKGKPKLLYLTLIGLVIAQLLVDIETVRSILAPLSLLCCVLLISPLGQRELNQHTSMLIFSCPSPLKKQLMSMFFAGSIILIIAVSGVLIRFLLIQDYIAITSLLVGIMFMVALAIACASLSRTSRMFEIIFTFIWYLGPMQQQSFLDFMGANHSASQSHYLPYIFLSISAVLLGLGALGRKAQMIN